MTGFTHSSDFPTLNQYQVKQGRRDSFITKLVMDNPPTVSIVSPTDGANVEGKVKVEAEAADDFGISQVNFYIDGELKHTVFPELVNSKFRKKMDSLSFKNQFKSTEKYLSTATESLETVKEMFTYEWDTTSYSYENHKIKVIAYDTSNNHSFDEITVLVHDLNLTLQVSRNVDKAWIIAKQYGNVVLDVKNPEGISVSKYIIYRKVNDGEYQTIREISYAEFQVGNYTYFDRYLVSDKIYTYQAVALNEKGEVIAKSEEVII